MKVPAACVFNPLAKHLKRNLSLHNITNKENSSRTLSPSFCNESFQTIKSFQKTASGLRDKATNSLNISKTKEVSLLDLGESLGRMEEYQHFCAKEYKLKEGQEAKDKVIGLKQEIIQKTKQQIDEKYKEAMDNLMESQSKEMKDFNEFWDDAVKKFEEQVQIMEADMLQRQKQEQIIKEDELRKGLSMKKKVSPQYLSYKRSFEALVKKNEFREAEKIKKVIEEIEREEMNKAYHAKEQRIKNFMNQLDHKHQNELNVLKKKISTGREKLMSMKVSDLEKLLMKFQNTRSQLEQDQNFELTKFEMATKTYRIGFNEISSRSASKLSNRTSGRASKSALRARESSNSKLQALNMSILSPSNTVSEFKPFEHVTMSVKNSKHKRNNTSELRSFKISEISGVSSPVNSFMAKRSNSVIRK